MTKAEILLQELLAPFFFMSYSRTRWILEVDGIDSFIISPVRAYHDHNGWVPIKFTLRDPIVPNAATNANKWLELKIKKDCTIKSISCIGTIYEKWSYKDAACCMLDETSEGVQVVLRYERAILEK